MKYITILFCTLIFVWPAVALGYIWACIRIGFTAGMLLSDEHGSAALEKFRGQK